MCWIYGYIDPKSEIRHQQIMENWINYIAYSLEAEQIQQQKTEHVPVEFTFCSVGL